MTERCRTVEPLLSAWLDHSLRPRERAAVGAHLPWCEHCQSELASLRRTSALLRAAPSRALPPEVRAALLAHAWPAYAEERPRAGLPRAVTVSLALLGALSATAWALGDESVAPPVTVPLDAYVTDHLQGIDVPLPASLVETAE
jgi:anti-sigma factor RsiW